jgi:hypothetical protein
MRAGFLLSGDDVRNHLIFKLADLVAQPELALFQPGELQLILCSRAPQGLNGIVKIAMLLPEDFDAPGDFLDIHQGPPLPIAPGSGEPRATQAGGCNEGVTVRRRSRQIRRKQGRQPRRLMIYFPSHHGNRGEILMENSHSSALLAKHAGIDARIAAEIRRPSPDSAVLAQLKKQKLRIKEMISGL